MDTLEFLDGSINGTELLEEDTHIPTTRAHLALYKSYVQNRLIKKYNGAYYAWSTSLNHWSNLISSVIAKEMMDVVDIMAPVNYMLAMSPYFVYLCRESTDVGGIPRSICVANKRISVTLDGNILKLKPVYNVALATRDYSSSITGFSIQPMSLKRIWSQYNSKSISIASQIFSQCFPDPVDLDTVKWMVGNALVDPVESQRVLILSGKGGSGKSTLINYITSATSGASVSFEGQILVGESSKSMPIEMANKLITSRICTCGEVDMNDARLNMRLLKVLTGGDLISFAGYAELGMRANTTIIIGTNHLPSSNKNPEWRTSQILRRLVIVRMNVSVRSLPSIIIPTNDKEYMRFVLECVVQRLSSSTPPLSSQTVLYTLFTDKTELVLNYIMPDHTASYTECFIATTTITKIMAISIDDLISMVSEMGNNTYIKGRYGNAIRGIRPRYQHGFKY